MFLFLIITVEHLGFIKWPYINHTFYNNHNYYYLDYSIVKTESSVDGENALCLTSVAPLARPVGTVRADLLQGVLLLPQAVHTLVPDGGEGALHQLTVCCCSRLTHAHARTHTHTHERTHAHAHTYTQTHTQQCQGRHSGLE